MLPATAQSLWFVMAPVLLLAGCRRGQELEADGKHSAPQAPSAPGSLATDSETPLAVINDVVITVGEFQRQLNRQAPYIRARYNSVAQKKEFLDNLVRFELLAQEAKKRGMSSDPEVVRATKQLMIQKMMRDHLEQLIRPEDITDEAMLAHFEANADEFRRAEQVRVSAIITRTKAQANLAAEAARQTTSNKEFRDLVERFSVDEETRLRGGDLRYLERGNSDWAPQVVERAFSLAQVGDVSGVFAARGKYYVLKKTGHRAALVTSFEDAKENIRNTLYKNRRTEAQRQLIAELREDAKITIRTQELHKVRVDRGDASPTASNGKR